MNENKNINKINNQINMENTEKKQEKLKWEAPKIIYYPFEDTKGGKVYITTESSIGTPPIGPS